MTSCSVRLFHRERRLHEILGGGNFADVVLWRQKNVTAWILTTTVATYIVFERSGYTLLSLIANVFLLLITILFLWAKAAAILNRPPPPLPDLHITEEMAENTAVFLCDHINFLVSAFEDITLGGNSILFFTIAAYLWIISIIGGITDLLTLGYCSIIIALTVPALYEKYEHHLDKCADNIYMTMQKTYVRLDVLYLSKIRKWVMEKRKLS